VLLQVVALARDVRADLHAVGQPHAGHLAQRGVRLLRRSGVHARAHTAPLRGGDLLLAAVAGFQARRGELLLGRGAPLADQLAGSRHAAASVAGAPIRSVSIVWRPDVVSTSPNRRPRGTFGPFWTSYGATRARARASRPPR